MKTSDSPAPAGFGARYFNPYRVASYLLVLFTLGHTFGAVVGTPRLGAESDAVVTLMKDVHVTAQGASCTWYGFYRGFGAFVSIFMAFSAAMAWVIGGMTASERRAVAPLTWALFAAYAATVVLDVAYFFPVPILFSCGVTAALGVACVRDARELITHSKNEERAS